MYRPLAPILQWYCRQTSHANISRVLTRLSLLIFHTWVTTYPVFKDEEFVTYERDCIITSIARIRFIRRCRCGRSLSSPFGVIGFSWVILSRVVWIWITRSWITWILGSYIRISRTIWCRMRCSFSWTWIMMIGTARMLITRIVMSTIWVIVSWIRSIGVVWSFWVIDRIFSGITWILWCVSAVRVSFRVSIVMMMMNVRTSGSGGCGSGCCCSSRWWWFRRSVIWWYSRPFVTCFRT